MIWEFFRENWRPLSVIATAVTSLFAILRMIVNSIAIKKIQENEIKHMQKDVKKNESDLKEFKDKNHKEDKEFKKELREELHKISLGMNRVERKIIKRDSICHERHRAIDKQLSNLEKR